MQINISKKKMRGIIKNKGNSCFDFCHRKQLLKSKRSQGHVEMILSFVIFLGFIGALFYFLNPFQTRQITYTILDITEEKLLEEWSVEYKTVSLILDEPASGCFSVGNQPELLENIIVKDEYGNRKNAGLVGDTFNIESSSGDLFYKVYSSDAFLETSPGSCTPLETGYTFGAIVGFDSVMESKITDFIFRYETNYEGLKKDLGIQNDFEVRVYEQDIFGEVQGIVFNATTFVPKVIEVAAKDVQVIAINNNADQLNLVINIRAW